MSGFRAWCRATAVGLAFALSTDPIVLAQETSDEPPPYFEVDDLVDPAEDRFRIHGRLDLTYAHFQNDRNMDGFDRDEFNTFSSAISLAYRASNVFSLHGEIEYDGRPGKPELDELVLRAESERFVGEGASVVRMHLDLGVQYIPFGIERFYYSPSTNPLVDRPSPFRRVYPGSYSDVGLFGVVELDGAIGATLELALTRGLRGPARDDRPSDFPRKNDQPQISGRIEVEPLEGLWFGVSGLWTSFAVRGGAGRRRLDLLGFDARWEWANWFARFEYVEGSVERDVVNGGNFRREGWYFELYRRLAFERPWLEAVELVGRLDSVDENSRERSFRDADRVALGLNWVPSSGFRLKTEVVFSKERGEQIANNGAFVQLEYHF